MSEAPEDATLPDDLAARTVTLLVRGAPAAVLATLVLGGASVLLALAGSYFASWADGFPWFALGFVPLLAAALGGVVFVHVAPLAAFAVALEGRAALLPTLRLSLRGARRILVHLIFTSLCALPMLVFGGVLVGIAVSVIATGSSEALVAIIPLLAGVVGIPLGCWLHGTIVYAEGARAVLGRPIEFVNHGHEKAVLVAGALPLIAGAAVAGAGAFNLSWLHLTPGIAVAATVVAVFAGNLVSSALAVAIASGRS